MCCCVSLQDANSPQKEGCGRKRTANTDQTKKSWWECSILWFVENIVISHPIGQMLCFEHTHYVTWIVIGYNWVIKKTSNQWKTSALNNILCIWTLKCKTQDHWLKYSWGCNILYVSIINVKKCKKILTVYCFNSVRMFLHLEIMQCSMYIL